MSNRIRFFFALVFLASLLCQPATQVQASAVKESVLSFSEAGYGDRSARSMYASLAYFLPVPQDILLSSGTTLHLVISHSELLKSEQSTMTVLLDQRSIYSTRLDESNRSRGVIDIDLPVEAFSDKDNHTAGYSLVLQFYMRLTDLICEETSNPALWATVHQESALHMLGESRSPQTDLALLPYPFYLQNSRQKQHISISLPPQAAEKDMAAALTLAAYFGQHSANGSMQFSSRLDGQSALNGHIIRIAPSANAHDQNNETTISLETQKDLALLTLSGSSPLEAARFLASPSGGSQLSGAKATLQRPFESKSATQTQVWQNDTATFLQLGAEERTLPGSGEQVTTYYFRKPAGWNMAKQDPLLVLHITHAGQLLPEQSGIRVRINGYDMGSIVYKGSPDENIYTLPLLSEYLQTDASGRHTTALVLELQVSQNLRQSGCEPLHPENAWTTVHADSYFYLPHGKLALPDVSTFPYPYISQPQNAPVTLVLPSNPLEEEIDAALQMAYSIGQALDGSLPPFEVLYADENTRPDGHVILIGIEGRNLLIDAIEKQNPASRSGIQQSALSEEISANLKEFSSPWQRGKSVLVLSGRTDSLLQMANSLGEPLPSGSILGMSAGTQKIIPLEQKIPPPIPPGGKPITQPPTSQPQTWHIILGVLGLTLIAILITLLVFRFSAGKHTE